MGDFSFCASAMISAWAPAQPAPHNSATRAELFSRVAKASTSCVLGSSNGLLGNSHCGTTASRGCSATSPEMTTTATPFLATATRMARCRICGSMLPLQFVQATTLSPDTTSSWLSASAPRRTTSSTSSTAFPSRPTCWPGRLGGGRARWQQGRGFSVVAGEARTPTYRIAEADEECLKRSRFNSYMTYRVI